MVTTFLEENSSVFVNGSQGKAMSLFVLATNGLVIVQNSA